MLTLKVVRECDIKEIHDLPKPTFGLEKYVETVMLILDMLEYGAWVEWGKLFFFKHYMRVKRYMAIFKERSSFGGQWDKPPT
jgi:hypothetical protein